MASGMSTISRRATVYASVVGIALVTAVAVASPPDPPKPSPGPVVTWMEIAAPLPEITVPGDDSYKGKPLTIQEQDGGQYLVGHVVSPPIGVSAMIYELDTIPDMAMCGRIAKVEGRCKGHFVIVDRADLRRPTTPQSPPVQDAGHD